MKCVIMRVKAGRPPTPSATWGACTRGLRVRLPGPPCLAWLTVAMAGSGESVVALRPCTGCLCTAGPCQTVTVIGTAQRRPGMACLCLPGTVGWGSNGPWQDQGEVGCPDTPLAALVLESCAHGPCRGRRGNTWGTRQPGFPPWHGSLSRKTSRSTKETQCWGQWSKGP